MALLDAELNGLKQKLRDLFAMFSAFAQSRYNETNEVSIYSYLLGFEEGRLADSLHKVQVKHDIIVMKKNLLIILEESDCV